jgi:hypothetical protein
MYLVFPIRLEDQLQSVAILLLPGGRSVTLDLQSVSNHCFGAGPDLREIRYGKDAMIPPLHADQAAWTARILEAEQG